VRAATRVKPEQASKGVTRAPSLLTEDEGRRGRPEAPTLTVVLLARVWGAARTHTRGFVNTGDLFGLPGQPGKRLRGRRVQQESQGPVLDTTPRWMTSIGLTFERNQDACVQRAMRVLRRSRLHLRAHALAANRRTLQRCAPFEESSGLNSGQDSSPIAAREPGAAGGGGARPEPHRAGMGGPTSATVRCRRRGTW
jgi:hypothetical protein